MESKLKKQKEAYDRGWSRSLNVGKEQHGNLEVNLKFLERINVIVPGIDVLEIGCGIGTVTNLLSQKGCQAIGTDISEEAVKYGRKKYPGVNLFVEPAEKLSFADCSVDVVISFDLIEHIHDVDKHIREVHRVLRDEGCYLFGTPNKYCSSVFDTIKHRNLDWKWSHPSLHSSGELRSRLRKHGFNCEFVKMNTVSGFMINKLRPYGPLALLAKHIDTSRLPLDLQSNFYVVARKL